MESKTEDIILLLYKRIYILKTICNPSLNQLTKVMEELEKALSRMEDGEDDLRNVMAPAQGETEYRVLLKLHFSTLEKR